MIKKSFKKGEMLIETVVAMAVFMIMVTAFFSVYKSFSAASKREAAYIFFESECLSIDSYYDSLGREYWGQEFFGDYYHMNSEITDENRYPTIRQNYSPGFEKVNINNPVSKYSLTCQFINKDMIVNVVDTETGRTIIDSLHYGQSEATASTDEEASKDLIYISDIDINNRGIRKIAPDEVQDLDDYDDIDEDDD